MTQDNILVSPESSACLKSGAGPNSAPRLRPAAKLGDTTRTERDRPGRSNVFIPVAISRPQNCRTEASPAPIPHIPFLPALLLSQVPALHATTSISPAIYRIIPRIEEKYSSALQSAHRPSLQSALSRNLNPQPEIRNQKSKNLLLTNHL